MTGRPATDPDGRPLHLDRVGHADGRLPVTVAVVVVLLVLAFWKPWSPSRPAAGTTSPAPVAVGTADVRSTARSTGVAPLVRVDPEAVPCYSRENWRLVTVEHSGRKDLRTWRVLQPVRARSPTDPRIPLVVVEAESVLALGYCLPEAPARSGIGRRVPTVTLWQVARRAGVVTRLGTPPFASPLGPQSAFLYRPPGLNGAARARWAEGRYIVEVDPGSPEEANWFAVQIQRPLNVPDIAERPAPSAPPSPGRS